MNERDIALIKSWAKGAAPVIKQHIEEQLAPFLKRIEELEEVVVGLKGQGLSFEGTYQRGKPYRRGHAVVSNGSLWIACTDTALAPGKSADWALAAKAGRDAKDAP